MEISVPPIIASLNLMVWPEELNNHFQEKFCCSIFCFCCWSLINFIPAAAKNYSCEKVLSNFCCINIHRIIHSKVTQWRFTWFEVWNVLNTVASKAVHHHQDSWTPVATTIRYGIIGAALSWIHTFPSIASIIVW